MSASCKTCGDTKCKTRKEQLDICLDWKPRAFSFIGTTRSAKMGPVTQALLESELTGEPVHPVILEAAKKLGYIQDTSHEEAKP